MIPAGSLPHRLRLVVKVLEEEPDRYGNREPMDLEDALGSGDELPPPVIFRARVDSSSGSEDLDDREQTTERFDIIGYPLDEDGELVTLSAGDELVWLDAGQGHRLKITAEVRPVSDRFSIHHLELDAERVRG